MAKSSFVPQPFEVPGKCASYDIESLSSPISVCRSRRGLQKKAKRPVYDKATNFEDSELCRWNKSYRLKTMADCCGQQRSRIHLNSFPNSYVYFTLTSTCSLILLKLLIHLSVLFCESMLMCYNLSQHFLSYLPVVDTSTW